MYGPSAVEGLYFRGQFVFAVQAGGITNSPTVGDIFLGIIPYRQFCFLGENVNYWYMGVFLIPFAGAGSEDLGDAIVLPAGTLSNNPADAMAAEDVRALSDVGVLEDGTLLIGTCIGIEASRGWVHLHRIPGIVASNVWY